MERTGDPKAVILRARKLSDGELEQIRNQRCLTEAVLHEHLCAFIRYKFLLEPEDCTTDSFNDWIQVSLAKSMHISKDLVAEFDRAKTCDGATSAMAKRILLLVAIQQGLQITLPAEEAAAVVTLSDLTHLVWTVMAGSEQWQHIVEYKG